MIAWKYFLQERSQKAWNFLLSKSDMNFESDTLLQKNFTVYNIVHFWILTARAGDCRILVSIFYQPLVH